MPAELDLQELLRVLERHEVEYVVVGAIAAAAAGAPVVTGDLDVTPSTDPANLDRLATALRELDARPRIEGEPGGVPFPVERETLATAELWTLTTRAGDLDLVFRPSGTAGYADLRRDAARVELDEGLTVLVASLADVIRSKEASNRPKDRAQLPLLRETLEMLRERR